MADSGNNPISKNMRPSDIRRDKYVCEQEVAPQLRKDKKKSSVHAREDFFVTASSSEKTAASWPGNHWCVSPIARHVNTKIMPPEFFHEETEETRDALELADINPKIIPISFDQSEIKNDDFNVPPPAVPETGVYVGALLNGQRSSVEQFNSEMDVRHAVFGEFFEFPKILTKPSERSRIVSFVNECKAAGSIPMLTLQTTAGLESYSVEEVVSLAKFLASLGTGILLRWNHEMNGSWYVWGQQPSLYIQKFRESAGVMHAYAPNVAMVWTPNQGWGYPWAGGPSHVKHGSADMALLDTDGDGKVTKDDDPYSPYYPGDEYVDWVGHSFYHWSNSTKLGINSVPSDRKWGWANGIANPIKNFHDTFAVGHNKPMIIAETSALYDPADTKGGGASEAAIKIAWIKQVYNLDDTSMPTLPGAFPMLKAILWFNYLKYESEVSGDVDWRINSNQGVIDYYQDIVADSYFIKAQY